MLKRICVCLLITLTAVLIIVIYMGRFLIVESPLEKADVVLLFLGGGQYKEVTDYLKEGWAKKTVFSSTERNSVSGSEFKGEKMYSSTAETVLYIRKESINDTSIVVLHNLVTNTADEASSFVKYLKQNPQIEKCIVVSNNFHMRRIKIFLNWFCKKEGVNVKFIYRPVHSKILKPVGWWKNSASKKFVISEYLKIVNFFL